ncbi:MAG: PEP-CTERM sorting domain-containing protein [Armatimonadota bacterium]
MRKVLVLSFTLVVLFSLVCTTFADDLVAPPWQRYSAGTTYALWEFGTNDSPVAPDDWFNPNGMPMAIPVPGLFQAWWNEWGGRQGVWPLSGTINVGINNYANNNPYKDIWIQLTWAQQTINVFPIVKETTTNILAELVQRTPLGPTGMGVGDGMWYHDVYWIRMYPNPDFENILIDGAVMVDQLVIDTICVPEPASILALLGGVAGIGGFALRRRK